MAKINNIEFNNFRNLNNYKLLFDKKLNIFFGKNGSGKTNILEGISLNAKGSGLRNSNLFNLIKNKESNFLIKNTLEIQNYKLNINIYSKKKNDRYKKIIKINDDSSKDSINFLNQSLSYLVFVPEMERLFQASPTYRRNFIDRLIFSYRKDYNSLINKYKKLLIERARILQNNIIDKDWLNRIEKDISLFGLEIFKSRYEQLKVINNNVSTLKNDHNFQFNLELKLKDNFFNKDITLEKYIENLSEARSYDKQYGGAKIGPHKSDILAIINNDFDASLLSTGQQKTVVLMILLAQCNYLVNYKNTSPILLLDEIASHLDFNNRQILLDMINRFEIQFFLTGTEKNLFSFVSTNANFYNIT